MRKEDLLVGIRPALPLEGRNEQDLANVLS